MNSSRINIEFLKAIKVGLQFPHTDLYQIALPWSDPKSGCECQVTVAERREIENRRETKNHTGEGSSAGEPLYHTSLNNLVVEANAIGVSVNYRLAPEHPLPTAYEDCWAVLNWVFNDGKGRDSWVKDHVDFERVFLVGDSAGANIAHHLALRIKPSDPDPKLKIAGIGMINPYFWGKEPIGGEVGDLVRKSMVDTWWNFVCPSEKGCDDPLINPFVGGSPGLEGLACDKILVLVAGKDILRDRGMLYYDELVKSKWGGRKELIETQGEDHVFHIFNPNCDKAKILIGNLDLGGDGGGVGVIVGDDDVIGQNDDVVLDFLRDALRAGASAMSDSSLYDPIELETTIFDPVPFPSGPC
nr:PUCXE35 protein [Pyrus ussuriensis]